MNIKELPDNYHGMIADGRAQYWSFGLGYYRKHNGTVIYKAGKRILDLAKRGAKERLKKLLINNQLNLFGG